MNYTVHTELLPQRQPQQRQGVSPPALASSLPIKGSILELSAPQLAEHTRTIMKWNSLL